MVGELELAEHGVAEADDRGAIGRGPKVNGALITDVVNSSPADRAGIKPGDVLVGVEGKTVTDYDSTLSLISALKPGNTATLKVLREKS